MKAQLSLSTLLGSALIFLSVFLIFMAWQQVLFQELILEWEITSTGSSQIIMTCIFDFSSLIFLSVVCLIAGSVMMFSTSYMSSEHFYARFLIILISFVASMFFLIISPNIISLLLGWDGLGVTSYLLVIFYQSPKSYNAGMITAITNRLGDVGLLITVGMFASFGSWSFTFFSLQSLPFSALAISILILSACTKSAQMPFSSWLPAAMAAPTPVSALVHSSTLVTAGIFLLIRFNLLLCHQPATLGLLLSGALTMVMAGSAALYEMDMKKIIALSTLSQLGVMMMTLGANLPSLSFFHLLSHAYFKAMLFMCAGAIIHSMLDYQDIRTMSLSLSSSPFIMSVFLAANLSLSGMPFLSGFYSKDLILESLAMSGPATTLFLLIFLGTALTVAYSIRVTLLLAKGNSYSSPQVCADSGDMWMLSGMSTLLPFSLLSGKLLTNSISSDLSAAFFPSWLKLFIMAAILSGVLMSLSSFSHILSGQGSIFHLMMASMWFMPVTFSYSASNKSIALSKKTLKVSESLWVNLFTHTHTSLITSFTSKLSLSSSAGYFLNSVIIIFPMILFVNLWANK